MKLKRQLLFLLLLLPFIMQAQQIIKGEYFIDTEPGTGNGIALPSFTADDSITQTVNLNTTGLSVGFHRVYYRYKYNTGIWGIPEDRLFYIYDTAHPVIATQLAILKGEYFIDTEPGVGNGTALPSFTAADSITQTINLNTTGLSVGFHRVYYRYKDLNNKWGIPEDRLFYVYDTTHPTLVNQPQITKGEYFVDTDPGVGNGTALSSFTAADSVNQTINYVTSGSFTLGSTHVIHIRYKDQNGKWGEAEPRVFNIHTCPANTFTQTKTLCPGHSIIVGTSTYTTNGTYTDHLASKVNGCDSTVTTNLTVLTANTFTQTLTKCAGHNVIIGTHTYTANGTYHDTIPSFQGCDSAITTHLTVLPANTFSQTFTKCAGQSITVGTHTYTTSNTYVDVLTSLISGCDSTVTTNLTVRPANTFSQSPTVCAGHSVSVGIHTYTIGNTYTDVLTSLVTGCDSTVTTHLTVDTVNTSVSVSTATITATATSATYQWINCNGNTLITGATNQTYTATANGSYAVIVTKNSCSDTSVCQSITTTGIAENSNTDAVSIYPNPFNQQTTIIFSEVQKNTLIKIMDVLGKEIKTINFSGTQCLIVKEEMNSGIYFIQITDTNKNVINRKIVVQ